MVEPLITEPSGIADWTRNVASSIVRGSWTLCPGIVTKVNSNMTVNVRLKVEDTFQMVELQSLPIVFPKGGGSIILTPISVNDVVLVGFSKYGLDGLLANTQIVKRELSEESLFNVEDAIVLGGFVLDSEKSSFQLPVEGITLGSLLQLLDYGGNPSSPTNGMLWRNGKKIYCHSDDVTFELGAGGSTTDMGKMLDRVNGVFDHYPGEMVLYTYTSLSDVARRLIADVKIGGFTDGRNATIRVYVTIDGVNWDLLDSNLVVKSSTSKNPHLDVTSQKSFKVTLEVYPSETVTFDYSVEVIQMEQ